MKAFTDISQSCKLAEFLPIESADMNWHELPSIGLFVRAFPYKQNNGATEGLFPCWSLAALLGVLPKNLHTVLAIGEQEKYAIGSTDTNKYDCIADNPVDACVAMIEKLHEQNIL